MELDTEYTPLKSFTVHHFTNQPYYTSINIILIIIDNVVIYKFYSYPQKF